MTQRIIWYASLFMLTTYVWTEQLLDPYWAGMEIVVQRQKDIIEGNAQFYNPWQYRMLMPYIIQSIQYITSLLWPTDVTFAITLPQQTLLFPLHLPFLLTKWILILGVLGIAGQYYRTLGLKHSYFRLLGVWALAFTMYPMQFSADLSLDIYCEVFCYLLAGWLMLKQQHLYLIPLILLAALNRESSGFIPLMLAVYYMPKYSSRAILDHLKTSPRSFARQQWLPFLLLLLYALVFISQRIIWGYLPTQSVYGNTHIWDFVTWNLRQPTTYIQFLRTFTLLPILVWVTYPHWPPLLKQWSILIIPIWVLIHFSFGIVRETRLFLVPIALIIVPGVTIGISNYFALGKTE